jgi:hypothetical protein
MPGFRWTAESVDVVHDVARGAASRLIHVEDAAVRHNNYCAARWIMVSRLGRDLQRAAEAADP